MLFILVGGIENPKAGFYERYSSTGISFTKYFCFYC